MTRPKILAYYFPDYHVDPRNEGWFGRGWTEWDLVRAATPRFSGHEQPRVPLLGYGDEADPRVAGEQIALARRYGVDGFVFDYYWYDDGPYLERALEEGFLRAENSRDLEFSLMWANHDLIDIFAPNRERSHGLLRPGGIGRNAFEDLARYVIDTYFRHPHHTRIEGRPRFSIYEIGRFVAGLGGVDAAADALRWFDDAARRAGHTGVHIDAVMFGFSVLPTEVAIADPASVIRELGIRSASSYVWLHHAAFEASGERPALGWDDVRRSAFAGYEEYAESLPVPFFPNVTVGWDPTPRVAPDSSRSESVYSGGPVWPPSVEAFRAGLAEARSFLERHPRANAEVTINAWNEWTEGSYLLPDTVRGHGFLEAILDVFGANGAMD